MLFHQLCNGPVEVLHSDDTDPQGFTKVMMYWCPICKFEVWEDTELFVSDSIQELEALAQL
jgi:hypothetical protein